MGKILVIPNSDFSRNHIVKVDITKQVEVEIEKTVDSSSTISDNNPSLKNNDQ